jgi:predicted phosphodiesterase
LLPGPNTSSFTNPETAKPTRVWVLGDAGTWSDPQLAVRNAYYAFSTNRHTDLWLMLGDNAYSEGTDAQYQGALFNVYAHMLRKSVLWLVLGNHDTLSTGVVEQFPYLEIFTLPTAGEAGGVPSGTEKYYSFNYGNIHFVALDSMSSNRATNGPMCAWLEQDLAATTNEWTIALWHHPPYTRGSHDSDDEEDLTQMRQFIVPILEAHGVDLVLCGHSHSYERSHLLRGHYGRSSTLVPEMIMDNRGGPYRIDGVERDGAVYVVAGSSGQITGGDLNHPAMFISLNQLGSLVLDIDRGRLDATFLQSDGNIGDTFTLLKAGARQPIRITSFNIDLGVMNIEWTANAGETYYVERTLSLSVPEWQRISPPITAIGESALWTWPTDAEPCSFFRVSTL